MPFLPHPGIQRIHPFVRRIAKRDGRIEAVFGLEGAGCTSSKSAVRAASSSSRDENRSMAVRANSLRELKPKALAFLAQRVLSTVLTKIKMRSVARSAAGGMGLSFVRHVSVLHMVVLGCERLSVKAERRAEGCLLMSRLSFTLSGTLLVIDLLLQPISSL